MRGLGNIYVSLDILVPSIGQSSSVLLIYFVLALKYFSI